MSPIFPVILSGGAGTRLWPQSRQAYPKQFLSLTSGQTLLQQTAERLFAVASTPPLVICNEVHRFIVAEQLRTLPAGSAKIILEPVGRNTAPAITLAALAATKDGADPIVVISPADHVVMNSQAFEVATGQAVSLAEDGFVVTFGVTPDRPETGYGYIKPGEQINGSPGHRIAHFVEKPNADRAAVMLSQGGFLWNSGLFVFKASVLLSELEHLAPEILAACRFALDGAERDLDFLRLASEPFTACPAGSFDVLVMERTDKGAVVELDAGWTDIGSWDALWQLLDKDADGNAGRGDVIALESKNSLVWSEKSLLAVFGVENLIVVESDDSILVADRGRAQEIRKVVARLDAEGSTRHQVHRRVYRPWGSFDALDSGERFQVKSIVIKPGQGTSMQLHHHRAEHWIVVRGCAKVTCEDREIILEENQSTYIPRGAKHRLENPGKGDLELIEVQSGSYLGEDDIVRFDDVYGRE
ncbi:mannose-1-phosphate guanylyltransferase/mannose-6-phosphate isomerase [Limibacillus sp. MBR-115]|jgi:mannose-1-phosphate guanylyltransferase/mannose-6-phosphate isomerase|uniref:mannose-1-phosphate guanylyltransferase/mannose-6-phosphate isomerase n=1 Tax=Limibacillus sp. MBR-115 TaxID=3156465 RepID=UPI003392754A